MDLTELVIALSQQQDSVGKKKVQIITANADNQRIILDVSAVFKVEELPGTVFIQTTNVPL